MSGDFALKHPGKEDLNRPFCGANRIPLRNGLLAVSAYLSFRRTCLAFGLTPTRLISPVIDT